MTTSNGNSINSHTLTQLCNKFPIGYNECHTFTPKLPLPMGQFPPHPLSSSLNLADLPTQMASRSNQSFFYNTPARQTNTHTQRERERD